MAEALINRDILSWARQRAEISPGELANAINVNEEKYLGWESGEKHPTFRQAQILAKKLFIPFGYLFLPEIPALTPQIADLRTVRDEQRNQFSLEFQDILNDAQRKQNWYKELLLNEGAQPLEFIGRFSVTSSFYEVARDIEQTLGVNQEFRTGCTSWENFLSKFIEKAEENGILILRNGVVGNNNRRKLSVNEFRGFVLSDPIAPLIFINNNDAQSAKIFTLAHELAHLWINESGVSNVDPVTSSAPNYNRIEKFCNKVAAELLVPEDAFIESWSNDASLQENLINLSRHFRVSNLVILIRAKTLGKITPQVFSEEYPKHLVFRDASQNSSGNFNNTLPVRNSKLLTRTILNSTLEGRTLYREAARLLGVKVSTINSLATNLGVR